MKFILLITGLLFFILPVPHTIAIRYALFGILLISLLYIAYQNKPKIFIYDEIKKVTILLGVLTIWIIGDSLFAPHFIQWGEIKGEWIIPIIYFYMGVLLAYFIDYKRVLLILVIALATHIIYIDLYVGYHYIFDGHHLIGRVKGLTGGPDKANYLTNILFAFLITEIIFRIRTKKIFIPMDNWFLGSLFVLTIFSSIVEGMRNGVIAILFLSITAIILTFYKNNSFSKISKFLISVFLIIVFAIPAIYDFKHDKRWQTLIQTIPIALDIKDNKYWFNPNLYSRPKLPNGKFVDNSNYQRIAWMRAGIEEVIKHPFGVGYSRNAFRHALQLDYKIPTDAAHSHSAILDLALGVGIIGVLLWIGFILYMVVLAMRYFKLYNNYFSVFLFFNVSGFFIRSLVDSNMRDHMFLTFMFLIGISIMYMLRENDETNLSAS